MTQMHVKAKEERGIWGVGEDRKAGWAWNISHLITEQHPRLPATQQTQVLAATRWQVQAVQAATARPTLCLQFTDFA
jgi:hypothetical protein